MTSVTSTPPAGRSGGLLGLVFGAGPLDRVGSGPAWALSAVLLGARLYLALPFWRAGLVRVDQWAAQSYLFELVHPLPGLSPMAAAYITTTAEIALPILLVLGLLGRLAAFGLAAMAATIYFVIGGNFAVADEQFPWMAVGLLLTLTGPGCLSIDQAIRSYLLRR
ncbi:MAG: DoxX family membrane protein [Rhodospirillaceae bacterium]|nr:DoxX family membrane protein [Rhodospirillaceae bacterium]